MENKYQQNSIASTMCKDDLGINANKMIRALSAIALEMQTFHADKHLSRLNFGDDQELTEKLSICKSNLRLKRKQIQVLKQNLRNACFVAKTVMSAKEKATTSLHNFINSAKSDCIDLYKKNITKTETIQSLISTNQALHEKIKILEDFIELGYQELQKMQNSSPKRLPTVMKLKEIIISCGQYYADRSNEHDTRLQLEQRNRFLDNQIKILINNQDGMAEELKKLRHQNSRLLKENASLKIKNARVLENHSIELTRYVGPFKQNNNVQINHMETNVVVGSQSNTFDLTSHLMLVKHLLNSQDFMLKDLKKLSEKLNIESNNTSDFSS